MFTSKKTQRFGIVCLFVLMLAGVVFADDKGDRLKAQHHIDYDVSLVDATFVATHNSFNNTADGYLYPNHEISLIVAVILFHDIAVKLRQHVAGQRLIVFGHLKHLKLEFGKLGLPEYRRPDPVEIIDQQVQVMAIEIVKTYKPVVIG